MNIFDLLNKMEAAEDAFLETEFLAPVLPNGQVRVRIEGVVCTLRVEGEAEAGWAILKPLAMDRARVVGKPSLRQRRQFLGLFPAVHLLLVARKGSRWLALPAHRGDKRFKFSGAVPVHFVDGAEPFQQIIARFDGAHFWFEAIDRRRSAAIAAYLRKALADETKPEALQKRTLTAEERDAYQVAHEAIEEAQRDQTKERLVDALAHAGAELASYIERKDAYAVSYTVDGRTYRSTIDKENLSVLVAGICLSGQDRRFDLQSLVGVLREGQGRRRMVHIGDDGDIDEESYWTIHPERS